MNKYFQAHSVLITCWVQGLRGEPGEGGSPGFPGARGPGGQKASGSDSQN